MLFAPGASAVALRLPSAGSLPRVDEHLVRPETREEMVRGRRMLAMPANPPHADQHCELDFVVRGHVAPGYISSSDLLTRAAAQSNFATDTCIRKRGDDPGTGARYLEELAFEVVNEQTVKDVTDRAEDLVARGVRRFFALFVKRGKVSEWRAGAWVELDAASSIDDPCLVRPIAVRALLGAAEADNAVARALVDKKNPVLMALQAESRAAGEAAGEAAGRAAGKTAGQAAGMAAGQAAGMARAILAVLSSRGVAVSDEVRARIASCTDGATLERWIARAAVASSAVDVLADS